MYEIYTLDFYKNQEGIASETNGILWGSYEDIQFTPIKDYTSAEKFFRICKTDIFEEINSNDNEQNIKSPSPSSMIVLYSLEDTEETTEKLWANENNPDKNFLAIILLTCEYTNNRDIKSLAKTIHDSIPNEMKSGVEFSCFGTLGMYDIGIIARTANVKTIFDFIDMLQKSISEQIKTSYTLVMYAGDKSFLNQEENKNCCDNNYIANVQITLAHWTHKDAILNKIKNAYNKAGKLDYIDNIDKYDILGEHDLCLHVPIHQLLLTLYKKGGILCSDSSFFKNNIQYCCTRIARKIESDNNIDNKDNIDDIDDKDNIDDKDDKECMENLTKLAQNAYFNNYKGFKRLLQILYVDFQKVYKLDCSPQLKDDLKCQFYAIVECVADALDALSNIKDNTDKYHSDRYEIISSMARLFSKSVHSVLFSSEMTINEPYTYLDTTALFPNVTHTYMSFVKKFLIFIYAAHTDVQSEIIPIAYIDSAINMPCSILYSLDTEKETLKKIAKHE